MAIIDPKKAVFGTNNKAATMNSTAITVSLVKRTIR